METWYVMKWENMELIDGVRKTYNSTLHARQTLTLTRPKRHQGHLACQKGTAQ